MANTRIASAVRIGMIGAHLFQRHRPALPPIHTQLCPNVRLMEAGLPPERSTAAIWRAIFQPAGGAVFPHRRRGTRASGSTNGYAKCRPEGIGRSPSSIREKSGTRLVRLWP